MFEKKKDTLIGYMPKKSVNPAKVSAKTNAFVNAGLKKGAETLSGNAALKYSTTGNEFVDEFGTAGRFRAPREFKDIVKSMSTLWAVSKEKCLKFLLYLRLVTRQVQFPDGTKTEETQRGQGLRHEGIFRMLWVGIFHPDVFWKNIHLFISVGGWKDVITMLQYDLIYHGWKDRQLDWDKMGKLIVAGLENPRTTNLVKKYLPQIKANSVCRTVESQADNVIAKWICSLLFGGKPEQDNGTNYKKYRKLKTSGTAHEWQKIISQRNLLNLNFDSIHGRALAQLVSGKFLKNNGLESRYGEWISKKPVAKFTGYVYELVQNIVPTMKLYQKQTIDAQFNQLVQVAMVKLQEQGLRPISAIDTSGSMSSPMYIGSGKVGKLRSISVAMASALFFDEMILKSSPFKNHYLLFSGTTVMNTFKGSGFCDRYMNSSPNALGGTNFESVFQFFADFRKANPRVPESEIPNMVICWSDGEFNRVSAGLKTNVERGREILKKAGYSKEFYEGFGLGFIDLPNTFYGSEPKPKFETFGDVKNVFYFSGHDFAPLAFLFGVGKTKGLPTTAEELFEAAMDQEVLNMIEV